jgi:phage tail tube protein FII
MSVGGGMNAHIDTTNGLEQYAHEVEMVCIAA